MLFGPGILIAGGATLLVVAIDKTLEGFGFYYLNTFLRLLLPIVGFGAAIYFLETNPILEWL